MGATETIANWIVDTSYEDIPPESVQAAREAYLDCLGLALSGSVQPLGRIITEYVQDQGGTPESTVLGPGIRVPAGSAALANGTFGCAMDLDPGPIMVGMGPALLAVGERIGATGRDLLEAFVVGNEMAVALEAVTHTNLQNRGIHAIGGGRISVAAACSKLLGLDAEKTAMAMGLATSTEGGLVSNQGTMTKPLHAGLIAKDGVMAALMVEKGFTGLDHVFDHPAGWYGASPSEGTTDMAPVAEALGHPIRIQHTKYIRRFPCCRTNHGMLDSILGLMGEHEFGHEDVESLEMTQQHGSIVMLFLEPEDEHEARFSALFCAAAALVDGKIGIETFTEEKVRDPVVKRTMDKVRINVRARWQESREDYSAGVPVKIRLKDGRVLEHQTPMSQIYGAPQNPWPVDAILDKFRENAAMALPEAMVEPALQTWVKVDEVRDLAPAVKTLVTG